MVRVVVVSQQDAAWEEQQPVLDDGQLHQGKNQGESKIVPHPSRWVKSVWQRWEHLVVEVAAEVVLFALAEEEDEERDDAVAEAEVDHNHLQKQNPCHPFCAYVLHAFFCLLHLGRLGHHHRCHYHLDTVAV
jgi:hypothetical protein